MKINKVLLGVFAGVLTLIGGSAKAQFYEMGPTNIGGHVSSLLHDRTDTTKNTLYAGAISGGLYVRTNDSSLLARLYANETDASYAATLIGDTSDWHLVRYIDATNQEMTLPVSALAQGPDGVIFIGTGDDTYPLGSTYTKMSSRGRGIYRFDPSDMSFTLMSKTSTVGDDRFAAVHAMETYTKNDTTYLYVATNSGLYRWALRSNSSTDEWNNATPRLVQSGSIDQLLVIRQLNMAYFTSGNQLYRIGNLAAADNKLSQLAINISSSNKAFGGTNTAIKLAVAPSNPSYLYAMVTDHNGILENVYLTTNGQTWTGLATSSVTPFSYSTRKLEDGTIDTTAINSGIECGAIAVDPSNEKHIIIAGSSIWSGEGFLEGATFTWTRNSYTERDLNYGDYMSSVYNSAIFVHSGIHKILPAYTNVASGDGFTTFYFATDGGVYSSVMPFYTFTNLNRGLNNVQINSVAVTPDGSLISGANANACPFIEARLAHNGGTVTPTWFDDGSLGNMNHDANILWSGNGGKVAASAFQQIKVLPHRNIFVSAANGRIGRSYTDYLNYTNTQTWTIGSSLLTTEVAGGPEIGSIHLWETNNNRYLRDSVKVALDMRGYLLKADGDTLFFTLKDKNGKDSLVNRNYKIKEGDHATFLSKANSEYPFEHVFSGKEVGMSVTDSFMIHSPIASRLLIVANISNTQTSVLYTWTPNDFSKIYDSVIDNNKDLDAEVKAKMRENFMWWAPMLTVSRNTYTNSMHNYARNAVLSPDGRYAYVSVYDDSLHRSQIYRVNGFEKVEFNSYPLNIRSQINFASDSNNRVLRHTILSRKNGSGDLNWFKRPISSITVDPRPGVDRLILTFEDYSEEYGNVVIIENPTSKNWEIVPTPINGHIELPAYCAMVEDSTGDIYVGTAEGVFIFNGSSWRQYEHLRGVPVTSIIQQTNSFEVKRTVTHAGINENNYLFAKTKWPRAIYFGTYGRGIFMDMTYVTDMENEISDPDDYNPPVNIPTVDGNSESVISIFPNPVMGEANLSIDAIEAGNATMRIYDINGRMVQENRLGHVSEGNQTYSFSTDGMAKGMYLVNVIIGGHTSATKMMVR